MNPPASKDPWHALDVSLEQVAREAAEYALMEAGALGTEANDSLNGLALVTAYFAEAPNRERVRAELAEALRIYSLPSSSVHEMKLREVADQDWLAEWKKSWQPVEVGERFLIAPPWSHIENDRGRIVIRIEPGMAFGTGTHETTRLSIVAIEKHFEGGSFLDVGTGTGILAIAAARLFPDARVEACDTDMDAVNIARENARLNGVAGIFFKVGTIDESSIASANCVCANLTADLIVQLLPALLGVTCSRLILSGVLETQMETVVARLRELGVNEPTEVTTAGEWVCLLI
jgi:ribosomal protein L11 methyltransferase